jgi:hypothetical protein
MTIRPIAVAVTAAAALAAGAASAGAATIQVDRGCYADPSQRRDTVTLTGTGFTPNTAYQVTLDGQPLAGGTGTTDATGAVNGTFVAPSLAKGATDHRYTIGVQEGANAPTAFFRVTQLFADFRPSKGDPKTLKVRFSLFGFTLQGVDHPTVYLHYIRPNGKLKKTYKIGVARGACGTIRKSSRRRLFPFHAERGRWRLQFDTSRRFHRGTSKSSFLFYTVGVDVKAR